MATAYVNKIAVMIPDHLAPDGAPVIDVATNEELVAALVDRAEAAEAAKQSENNAEAVSALAEIATRVVQLEQRAEADRKTVDLIAGAHAAAVERANAAQADAARAVEAAAAVPAVDVSAVARLSAEVIENGQRAVNLSAQAQEQITALAASTTEQVQQLSDEVEQVQGNATATVTAIQAAADAINSGVRADVDALLATVPGDVSAAVRARLDQVEVITGGRVKGTTDADRFTWEWTFATLGDPETVSPVVPMPILPGWEGVPGRSGAPIQGGGSGGSTTTAGKLIGAACEIDLRASIETPLIFRPRPGANGVVLKQDVDVRFQVVDAVDPTVFSSSMLSTATAGLLGDGEFTVAAELFGPGGDLDLSFRVVRLANEVRLFATAPQDCKFRATIAAVVGT